MTVRRRREIFLDEPLPRVAKAVRVALHCNPPYRVPREEEKDRRFVAVVRPSFWVFGAELTVELTPCREGTQLVAATRSPKFVLGDLPNAYNGYLDGFFKTLREALEKVKRVLAEPEAFEEGEAEK